MGTTTSKIVIAGLAFGCLALGAWYYVVVKNNYRLAATQVLTPFTAAIDPTTGNLTNGGFNNAAGEPQIQCPVGTSVNIVGAFYDIADPFGECTTSPSQLVEFLCNPNVSSPSGCSNDDDCPEMTSCSSGVCSLTPQKSSTVCPNGYSLVNNGGYWCVPTDICGPGIPNPVCSSPNNANACTTRDATTSVGLKCNGRSECPDLDLADFGPSPCPNLPPMQCLTTVGGNLQWTSSRTGYCGLPYNPGWPGGTPPGSTPQGTPAPQSASIGYTLHGLYTCV